MPMLTRLFILGGGASVLAALAAERNAITDSTAVAPRSVNGYTLIHRLQSLPGTFGPSTAVTLPAPQSEGTELEPYGLTTADAWMQPILSLTPGSDHMDLALAEAADNASVPLGLPLPFESEVGWDLLALARTSSSYRLRRRLHGKSNGEVWRAVRTDDPTGAPLIVKRLALGTAVCQAGLRESHFGTKLKGLARIARFIEAFEAEGSLWLVFRDEGLSLDKLLYHVEQDGVEPSGVVTVKKPKTLARLAESHAHLSPITLAYTLILSLTFALTQVKPSHVWLSLRRERGHVTIRHILRQVLEGLAMLHARNVTHRDIKPPNILVASPEVEADGASAGLPAVRLADFGSAVDEEVMQPHVGMYPLGGPSVAEETEGYQPPESSLGGEAFAASSPASYDLWSVGILALEMLLGRPGVMPLSPRAEAVLRLRYADAPPAVLGRLVLANALAEHCIMPPSTAAASRGPADAASARGDAEGAAGHEGSADGSEEGGRSSAPPTAALARQGQSGSRRSSSSSSSSSSAGGPKCGKAEFASRLAANDPLARVSELSLLSDPSLREIVDLAWEMLRWRPADRMSAAEALRHPALSEARARAAGEDGAGQMTPFRPGAGSGQPTAPRAELSELLTRHRQLTGQLLAHRQLLAAPATASEVSRVQAATSLR